MGCSVIDIRGKSKEKLSKFLIIVYLLNIVDLILTKLLLWKVPNLFSEINMYLRPIIHGIEPYFIKVGLMALVLLYWYWRSQKSNITQIRRSILVGKMLMGTYILINIIHLVNLAIYLKSY